MKRFGAYVNEQLTESQQKYYKNYVFNQGIFISEDGSRIAGWKEVYNFSKNAKSNYFLQTQPTTKFQFIQGVPVVSIQVSTFEKSGNVVIDDIDRFWGTGEFKYFNKYVKLKQKRK